MPQIAQIGEIYASQLFWLLVFFGAILVVIGYGMLPKIQATIDARDAKIAADLKSAEDARTAAAVAKADQSIATTVDKATAKLAEARAAALAEIEAVAADAAQQMVSRVAGLSIDAGTARASVAKELAHG